MFAASKLFAVLACILICPASGQSIDQPGLGLVTTSTLISVLDHTKSIQLFSTSNGNLNISLPASVHATGNWVASDGSILTDAAERWLHYYPDTMKTYGVSRIRVAAWGSIPKTANLISLSQIAGTSGAALLLAIDTLGNYFYPVVCTYSDQSNKVFLAKDINQRSTLVQPSLRYIITGGNVTQCDPLALQSAGLTAFHS
ncbi:hypothetical protein K461DRAFT_316433 [Myriangium duriaei CBS 260.36]|uniref:Uncharacterized protein n=1 Tax=Myriangium duriaei CBS 260.36 TaxID=1168546 RepID=A0A9P4MCA8_9PEZI|nr:hypothetical protein K461DRAFT_316433 [Myriangium duriaei CBS 260.36]